MIRNRPRQHPTLLAGPAVYGRAILALLSPAAFTLIELLVVAGILSVLAAMAIPAFHQAQMRAKIAASKNNLRVIEGAMEVYRMDHNHYPRPVAGSLADDPYGVIATSSLSSLTTPVAYIDSAALRDRFGLIQPQVSINQSAPPAPEDPFRPPTPDVFPAPDVQFNTAQSMLYFYYPSLAQTINSPAMKRECYAIVSVGPDRKDSFIVYYPFPASLPATAVQYGIRRIEDTVYDPSNGAQSGGDLAGFGPEARTPNLVGGGGN